MLANNARTMTPNADALTNRVDRPVNSPGAAAPGAPSGARRAGISSPLIQDDAAAVARAPSSPFAPAAAGRFQKTAAGVFENTSDATGAGLAGRERVHDAAGLVHSASPRSSPAARLAVELPARVLIGILRDKAALGGAIVLSEFRDVFLAADDDAAVVSDASFAPIYPMLCDGQRIRVAVIARQALDDVVRALTEAGHRVALAAAVEDPDASGFARTAIVRVTSPSRKESPVPPGCLE